MLKKCRVFVVFQTICLVCLIFFAANTNFVSAQSFQKSLNVSSPDDFVDITQDNLYVHNNVVYAVWAFYVGQTQMSYMRRSFDGGYTWQPKQTLGEGLATMFFSGNNAYVLLETLTNVEFYAANLRRSTDGGATFSPVQQLAQGFEGNRVTYVRGFASGSTVFVTWHDGRAAGTGGPFYRRSNDNGVTFDAVQTFPEKGAGLMFAASGNYLYAVYQGLANNVYFRRSTDNGNTYEPVKTFTASSLSFSKIVADQNNVSMLWLATEGGNPRADLFFVRSTDSGATFEAVKNISNSTRYTGLSEMAISGQNVFVIYEEEQNIFYTRSVDGGANFQNPVTVTTTTNARNPSVKIYNSTVYTMWEQRGLLTNDYGVAYKASNDYGANFSPRQTIFPIALNAQLILFNNIPLISARTVDDNDIGGLIIRRSRPLPPRGFLLNKILQR